MRKMYILVTTLFSIQSAIMCFVLFAVPLSIKMRMLFLIVGPTIGQAARTGLITFFCVPRGLLTASAKKTQTFYKNWQ